MCFYVSGLFGWILGENIPVVIWFFISADVFFSLLSFLLNFALGAAVILRLTATFLKIYFKAVIVEMLG